MDAETLRVVTDAAEEMWQPDVAQIWLRSANAHLGFARPIDVAAVRGPGEVLEALRAERSGAFA